MYIVAIGWLFVVAMMAITSASVLAGFTVFLGYGVLPLGLFLWIAGTPQRRRRAAALREVADEEADQRDRPDAQ
ncbi:MAG TPA: hypothetical protein VHB46_05455 [Burkholderiales bacterium]|nr:hypothetical protein [Burkholderiales bacterium]